MKKPNFSLGAKALIIEKNKVLMIKRRLDDVHKPGEWDLPGGRISFEEDLVDGIKREVKEETNLDVEVICPIWTKHFTRDDGQIITAVNFYCKLTRKEQKVKLSKEHTEYIWETIPTAKGKIYHELIEGLEKYEKMKSGEMFK